jgi:hypothetical protein
MFRGLALAFCVVMPWQSGSTQAQGVVHVAAAITNGGGTTVPVTRHVLLVSDRPPSAPPRRVTTAADGGVDITLNPGSYIIESDRPFVLEGQAYRWTMIVDISASQELTLALTGENAEVVPATEIVEAALTVPDIEASLLARWQESVVELWTPIKHGSGFVTGPDGLIVTDAQVTLGTTTVAVQLSPQVKVEGLVIASDATRGVALVRIHPSVAASVRALPLPWEAPPRPPLVDQEIIALEAPLGRRRRTSNGLIEAVLPNALDTDLVAGTGASGGPAFGEDGDVLGVTIDVPERDVRATRRTRVIRLAPVCELIASVRDAIGQASPPATALPVEPSRSSGFPTAASSTASVADAASYQVASSDFDVTFITPPRLATLQERSRSGTMRWTGAAGLEAIREQLMADFGNWSDYVDTNPPVLLVRVTPKFVEGFWMKVARGVAMTQGASIPAIKRPRPNFSRLRASCGAANVTPSHPFRIQHQIADGDMLVEGLYAFDPKALSPECGPLTFELFSEKDSEKGDRLLIDAKVLEQVQRDFVVGGR